MQEPSEYTGRTLVDSAGDEVGTVEEVYVDQETKHPEWVLVKADPSGMRRTFVPVTGLRWEGNTLKAPYRKDQIASAPQVGDGAQASAQDEGRLFQHYGIPYSKGGTVTAKGVGEAHGGETAETTREALREPAEQASQKAREVGATLQGQMREQVDARSTQVGKQVDSVSQAMWGMGDQLRSQGNDLPAQLADQAAAKAEQLGRYLREADSDRILRDVEDFGRRQPWVMAAAGLALGVAAARFLGASSRRRYQSGGYGGQRAVSAPSAERGPARYGMAPYQESASPMSGAATPRGE